MSTNLPLPNVNPFGPSPETRVCHEPRLIRAVLNELLPFLRAEQTEQPAERSLTPPGHQFAQKLMSWIKLKTTLQADPAVAAIADKLNMDDAHVVGCLAIIWSWADNLTVDGYIAGATCSRIDRMVRRKGFAEAMIGAGWLENTAAGLTFPKWDRHNSESAKARAGEQERKRLQRLRHNVKPTGPDALPASGHTSDKCPDQIREEDMREDKTKERDPQSPKAGLARPEPPLDAEPSEPPARPRNLPSSETEAVQYAGLITVPEAFIRETWHRCEAVGWFDTQGRLIRSWPSYLVKAYADAKQRGDLPLPRKETINRRPPAI
jgi:hypothetical protein